MNIFINFKGESMVKYIANVPYHKKIVSNHNVLNMQIKIKLSFYSMINMMIFIHFNITISKRHIFK